MLWGRGQGFQKWVDATCLWLQSLMACLLPKSTVVAPDSAMCFEIWVMVLHLSAPVR